MNKQRHTVDVSQASTTFDEVCGQVYFKTLFINFTITIYHLIINPWTGMQVCFCLPDNFPKA